MIEACTEGHLDIVKYFISIGKYYKNARYLQKLIGSSRGEVTSYLYTLLYNNKLEG